MTDNQNMSMDQVEFMKRMKAIASDLWGGAFPADPAMPAPAQQQEPEPEKPVKKTPEREIRNLWKTADETIDWTDALAHASPTDGLTGPRMWAFYHKHAEKVLAGDLDAYTEVLQKANPLGELTEYAEGITMRAPSADRLESCFVCRAELMEKDRKLYLAAMGLRIARDLLACLPAEEVAVTAEENGKTAFKAVYTRQQLLHRNFNFVDPVALSEEFGAEYN